MTKNDMESVNRKILDRRRASNDLPPYSAAKSEEIEEILSGYFAKQKPGAKISGVRRVGGGLQRNSFSSLCRTALVTSSFC